MLVDRCKSNLLDFLRYNPGAELEEVKDGDKTHCAITNPWNDDSVNIIIDENNSKLLAII